MNGGYIYSKHKLIENCVYINFTTNAVNTHTTAAVKRLQLPHARRTHAEQPPNNRIVATAFLLSEKKTKTIKQWVLLCLLHSQCNLSTTPTVCFSNSKQTAYTIFRTIQPQLLYLTTQTQSFCMSGFLTCVGPIHTLSRTREHRISSSSLSVIASLSMISSLSEAVKHTLNNLWNKNLCSLNL